MSYGTKSANAVNTDRGMTVDTGPRERASRNGGVIVAEREFVDAGGIQTTTGVQAAYECVLDAMLGTNPAKGMLAGTQGSRADRAAVARSRYEAGIKLRRLFVDAGLVGVRAFDPDSRGGGQGELTDKQALARREYNDTVRRLGVWASMAAGPCCFDVMPQNERVRSNVCRALDELCLAVL